MLDALYLNLPVRDRDRSAAFFSALGFEFVERFSDPQTFALAIGADTVVLFSVIEKFEALMKRPVAPLGTAETALALKVSSREAVRSLVEQALALGAGWVGDCEDHGFMVSWGFADLDGHLWEAFWFNPDAPSGPGREG